MANTTHSDPLLNDDLAYAKMDDIGAIQAKTSVSLSQYTADGVMRHPTKPRKSCCQRISEFTFKDWLKVLFVLFLITFFTLAIVFSDTTTKIFTGFLNWMSDNIILGSLVYIFVYALVTVLMIPGSIFTLGAGFVFNNSIDIPVVKYIYMH